jgi:hypothetical protein
VGGKPCCGNENGVTTSVWGLWSGGAAPRVLPGMINGPATVIVDGPCELGKCCVGDTGIEPVTSSV